MRLAVYVFGRLLWMVPSLLGITLVTFLLMDLAPEAASRPSNVAGEAPGEDAELRERRLRQLRINWGMADPETGELYPVLERYGIWLARVVRLDFAGRGTNRQAFRERVLAALPVTLFLNALAILVALGVAIPLGARLGMRIGSLLDRGSTLLLFVLYAVPPFLFATLLVLLFSGPLRGVLPVQGLSSESAGSWSLPAQFLDMLWHLLLPVLTLALGPAIVLARHLRDSVGRAAASDYVLALRGWGTSEREVRRTAVRGGLSPLVTLIGTMTAGLVTGSVVVENVFHLPGLGVLAFDAMLARDYPMVMALTLLVGVTTLLGLLLSDILQRVVDPRVRLP